MNGILVFGILFLIFIGFGLCGIITVRLTNWGFLLSLPAILLGLSGGGAICMAITFTMTLGFSILNFVFFIIGVGLLCLLIIINYLKLKRMLIAVLCAVFYIGLVMGMILFSFFTRISIFIQMIFFIGISIVLMLYNKRNVN